MKQVLYCGCTIAVAVLTRKQKLGTKGLRSFVPTLYRGEKKMVFLFPLPHILEKRLLKLKHVDYIFLFIRICLFAYENKQRAVQ